MTREGKEEFGRDRAWSYALVLLTRRAHTEAEIRERLERKGATDEVVRSVLVRLAEYRLVDDTAFAEDYVRMRSQKRGSLALRQELRRKGVPEEAAARPLERHATAEPEMADQLLRRNAWRFSRGPSGSARARAFAFLARRGFPAEVAKDAVEGVDWPAEGDGSPE